MEHWVSGGVGDHGPNEDGYHATVRSQAATLPLCCLCFACTGWLAGVHWDLHPVSGCSHRGCDCSLDDSVVVLFGSTCL